MSDEILKVHQLTVRFGGLKAVDAVDFSILRNEIVSLIGPNGAGKTTTFNAITGFLKKSGTVELEGRRVENLRPYQLAERGIVRTFQITSLFRNLSVVDNIRTARHKEEKVNLFETVFNTRRKQIVEEENLQTSTEILKFIGLENMNDVLACNLPYGEQRILEIGVALAARPKVLLLDEPSAGLNNYETEGMMTLIRKMRSTGITVLVVEHDMKLVMGISNRIIVLNFGKKIATGTPDEIKNNPEVIKAYLGERRRRDVKN